jgi:hypothetical protein
MPLCEAPCNVNLTGAMMDSPHPGIANSVLMFDTVQTKYDLNDRLFLHNLKEDHYEYEYEYRSRTLTGTCDRDINFAGTEVFKLFRGRVFDRRGHLGANAP